jgi:hypothetical protein
MPRRASPRSAALSDYNVLRAIRYMLQLGLEWRADRAAYRDGAAVLAVVAERLEEHRQRRLALKRKAQLAELVPTIMERLEEQERGYVYPSETRNAVMRWLKRVGINCTEHQVKALLELKPRQHARERTRRERLTAGLADLIGASQSDLEKAVDVASRGKENAGRLGNAMLHERAAMDRMSGPHDMLNLAMDAIDMDVSTRSAIQRLLSLDQIKLDEADREQAAKYLRDGSAARRMRKLATADRKEAGKHPATGAASNKAPPERTRRRGGSRSEA